MRDVADLGDGVEDLLAQAGDRRRTGLGPGGRSLQWGNRHGPITPSGVISEGEDSVRAGPLPSHGRRMTA